MSSTFPDKLVIAISSRALFDLDASHRVFVEEGVDAYFGADIFFDDQQGHCESARQHVATGHVPYGVANGQVVNLVGKAA